MVIFLGAFLMVFFAEMGDKSQILAMNLATRYSVKIVLLGVIIATLLNNGLAVLAGYYLGVTLVNTGIITIIASLIFIFFGLWTLKEEKGEGFGEEEKQTTKTPLLTVTATLILAEFGDKTQLATLAYAVNYQAPFITLLGVLAGMLLADALGIFTGAYISRKVSRNTIKKVSAAIFIVIGLIGLLTSLNGMR